ncbi:MAG: glycoside hydrolase family 13 protein [Chitinophagaceae bacterium]
MKKIFLTGQFLLLFSSCLLAQQGFTVYPTHWWAGMKNPALQLMIHSGKDIAVDKLAFISSSKDVKVTRVTRAANRHYIFVDLTIAASAKPQTVKFSFGGNIRSEWQSFDYQLKARSPGNGKTRIKGITSEDLIYLIMPDRFSNGDPSNDRIPGMRDQSLNRDTIFERHGGDLKGIENHLDYLQDLGVTALWLNPVIENDMPNRTEHGYAFTDHYKVDPRIGGEKAYHDLVDDLHSRSMKIIQDAVYNHVGIEHFLFRDMPDSSWFHKWPIYTNTTYKDQVLMDPYAAAIDRKKMSDGWFVRSMPDVNQGNPFFATFLIQHAIWSTEEYGLDGWRIDTYAYNDLDFMNRCNKALLDEYPQLHLFGETWVHGVLNQAYFTQNNLDIPYKSNLPAVTDFQTNLYGIINALNQPFGWTEGVNKLYSTLANDFVYKDPMKLVIFLDNHDMSRFYSQVNEDLQKYKMGITWLLTCRGIPQLYYGTEILMAGVTNPDGWVRLDFKGGWPGDRENKFMATGRTRQENEAFEYVKTLARFRLHSSAIKTGKLMQYVPEDGLYTYFRYDAKQTVMVIMNTGDKNARVKWNSYSERTKGFTRLKDAITGKIYTPGEVEVKPKESFAFELLK